jgi:O-acetyl-ADP-ribose deacetylase (regulator of RNase III)
MIKLFNSIKGDLLKEYNQGACDVIAHCTNCQGVMGSGIALQIKNEMPAVFDAYKYHEECSGLKLGTISYAKIGKGIVVNLHAQNLYGYDGSRFVNYEAIYETLRQTKEVMLSKNLKTLGVPYKMACDRAGGDWRIIETMLNVIFENSGIDILVVEYAP